MPIPDQVQALRDELLNENIRPTERLASFVGDLDKLLEEAISAGTVLFRWELRESLPRAHVEAREACVYRLQSLLVGNNELSQGLDGALESAGLTGAQLHSKLLGYSDARIRFLVFGSRRYLKRALRWANTLLGSLSTVLPIAEPLLELKETVENGATDVDEMEDWVGTVS